MKAITFLGAGKAYETTYSHDNDEHTANYFGVALARFYPALDSMKVFVTAEARKKHWEPFKRQVEDFVDHLEAVDIPNGADEDELWLLFQTVVDAVDEREDVIFDITHGFRTLPFLSLLAVAYLRQVKDIQLGAVLYGNYEARDHSNRAPVIDLSGFVSLFDWMPAADRFTRFGDASDLAERLREVKPDRNQPQNSHDQIDGFLAGKQGEGKPLQDQPASSLPPVITADMLRQPTAEPKEVATYPDQSQQANRLARVANSLERVSKSLGLIRPDEAMGASASLCTILSDQTVLDIIKANARPFALLTESIRHEYEQLSLSYRQQSEQPTLGLERERDMVNWLLSNMRRRSLLPANGSSVGHGIVWGGMLIQAVMRVAMH